eukprot:TRINITY_DN15004_c0_g1_i5.p1 TRINITY_DN15004_c0_g1~~TRINITY_DN15004_c0_g1_i5.p1  ORF type:complete len:442 (+),score=115.37 TRINITY_DN15004_c0_g1_i5:134-1459(+)
MGALTSRLRGDAAAAPPAELTSIPFHEFLCLLRTSSGVREVTFRPNSVLEVVLESAERVTTRAVAGLSVEWVVDRLVEAKIPFFEGRALPSRLSQRLRAVLLPLIPLVYLALTYGMMRKLMDGPSQGPVGQTRRKKTRREGGAAPVTWRSVAGIDAARAELMEIVSFLHAPERFRKMGARCPRGLLLSGPPGCGKTLLARAAAHEAGAEFITCSASDFVEVFVGRGAARVRELFRRAERCAPCILFFDELDALAKSRVAGFGNDEREQTLNQLLTEMDGFDSSDAGQDDAGGRGWAPVVVIAATNRPEVLDAALVRPGRFDRHVCVELPGPAGRLEVLRVHVRERAVPLQNADAVLPKIAARTQGFSGAELANVVNEAALLAVRDGADEVAEEHLLAATAKALRFRAASLGCVPSDQFVDASEEVEAGASDFLGPSDLGTD